MKNKLLLAAFAGLLGMTSCDKNENVGPTTQRSNFFKHYELAYNQKPAAIARTNDGGYLVLGSVSSSATATGQDLFYNFRLVRTDSLGQELWSKTYGNTQYDDQARRIIVLPNNQGYLVAGTRQRIDFSTGQAVRKEQRIHLYRLDLDGNITTESTLPNSLQNEFNYSLADIKILSDGDFALVGTTTDVVTQKDQPYDPQADISDIYIAKVQSSNLTESWHLVDGFKGADEAVSLHPDGQDNYIVIGSSKNTANSNADEIFVGKYRDFGFASSVSSKLIAGDQGRSIKAADAVLNNGTLTVLGNEQAGALVFMQFNVPQNAGTISRSAAASTYTNGSADKAGLSSKAASITLLADGSFLVTSTSTRVQNIDTDLHLLKMTPQLQIQWDALFGNSGVIDQAGSAMVVQEYLPNSSQSGEVIGYAAVGAFSLSTNNAALGLIKTDVNGAITNDEQ